MKTFGFTILSGGVCVTASLLLAQPLLAANTPPSGATIQRVAYGDAPMPGHRRGGRRHGGKTTKSVDPAVPALNGATREGADKEYKKKYGF